MSAPESLPEVQGVVDRKFALACHDEAPVTAPSPADVASGGRVATVYEEHAARLGRLAYLLTGDAALAEDLVQEAFVRAFARFVHLRQPEAIGGYLQRTVVNLARKQFRRTRNERECSASAGVSFEVAAQPDVELREQLWSAMRALPYRQRAALVLRFYEDKSEREIARCLGCRVGTVKSVLHRALTALREQIGGEQP